LIMKKLLILLLISSACSAQTKHIQTTDADIKYIHGYSFNKMNEPELYNDTSSNENYRFIWIRSFHHPLIIRIEKRKERFTLYWKEWSGEGGYSWGDIVVDDKKLIDEITWETFLKKLALAKFNRMSTVSKDIIGFDGAQWVLEGKTPTTYHVVDRWSPSGTPFFDCCNYLITLTGIKIKDEDKY
jgi:hypothetical protein